MIVHVLLVFVTANLALLAGWRMGRTARDASEFSRGWHLGRMCAQASVVAYIDELQESEP